MARKIGQPYEGDANDRAWRLWWRGARLSVTDSSWRTAFANSAWLTLLALAPRRAAAAMVVLRFNRAEFLRSVREKIDWGLSLIGRTPAKRPVMSGAAEICETPGTGLSGRD
jgi:hypothetical protein